MSEAVDKHGAVDPPDRIAELEDEVGELEAKLENSDTIMGEVRWENERLLEALLKYGQHLPPCARHKREGYACNCGLEDALRISG